ncbi:KH domain-containing protein [Candidatus Micrarchaeota archaeon]|nr:KH domain-containing protein [Candidatus Micrarchaeota archaeon]
MTDFVRIPAERVGVLLGKDDATKKKIEKRCNVELVVDHEGEVEIIGDPADVFFVHEIVKAIGRGFSAETALKLLGSDYGLYIIPLKELISSENAITRLKGRVIGEKGKIKAAIEDATDSYVSIYGNTIAIIARIDTMEYAKEAIGMLIDGARHTSVLAYLAKSKRGILESRLKGG